MAIAPVSRSIVHNQFLVLKAVAKRHYISRNLALKEAGSENRYYQY